MMHLLLLAMSCACCPVGAQAEQELAPIQRLWVPSSVEGHVLAVEGSLKTGSTVTKGQELILVVDPEGKKIWVRSPVSGIVLSLYFREALTNRYVKANESLLCIGYANQQFQVGARHAQEADVTTGANDHSERKGFSFIHYAEQRANRVRRRIPRATRGGVK